MKKFIVAAAAVAALVSAPASATVTFDPATGNGWVGKGDVQNAFGLKNASMQAVHQDVTFTYADTQTVEYTCEWFTGPDTNRKRHEVTREREGGVLADLASDSRKTGQWTGWFLTGFDGDLEETGDEIPAVGDPCPGNEGTDAEVIEVVDLGSSGGVLKAWIDGDFRIIWP